MRMPERFAAQVDSRRIAAARMLVESPATANRSAEVNAPAVGERLA
jgi:hypothetical protein